MKIKFYGIKHFADPDTAQDGWFPGGGGPIKSESKLLIASDKRPAP